MKVVYTIKKYKSHKAQQKVLSSAQEGNLLSIIIGLSNSPESDPDLNYIKYTIEKYNKLSIINWEAHFTEDTDIELTLDEPVILFHCVKEGAIQYQNEKFKNLAARTNEYNLWKLDKGIVGTSRLQKLVKYASTSIFFKMDYAQELILEYPEISTSLHSKIFAQGNIPLLLAYHPYGDVFQHIIEEIMQTRDLEKASNIYIESKLKELFAYHIYSSKDIKELASIENQNLQLKLINAKELLFRDICNTPKLRELAKQVGLNDQYFKKGFKELFGKPPIQLLNEFKLAKAIKYLENTTMNISEIAHICGFSSHSYFNKSFRYRYKISPSGYRRALMPQPIKID